MKKLLAVLLSIVYAGSVYSADDSVVIALAGPRTGPVTQYGEMELTGAQLAAKILNEKGGMNGKKIVTKVYDDACEPKQAVSVANQIVDDNVKFVVGHLCSSSTLPAAEIYNEEGVVMITPAATDPSLTQKGFSTVFRTIGTDEQSAPTSAKYIADVLKPQHIALLHDKQQYGQGLVNGVARVLKEKGINPDIIEGVNQGQTDFSALITKLKNANIDFVYWGGYHPEIGLIIRQGVDQGFTPQYMGADGIDNPDLFAIAGRAAEGILATVPKNFSDDPKNAELVKALKDSGKDASGAFVLPSYAALQVIVDAANKAGNNDPEAVVEVLHKEKFDTPLGEISFSKEGDLKDFNSVIYELHADGSRELKTQ